MTLAGMEEEREEKKGVDQEMDDCVGRWSGPRKRMRRCCAHGIAQMDRRDAMELKQSRSCRERSSKARTYRPVELLLATPSRRTHLVILAPRVVEDIYRDLLSAGARQYELTERRFLILLCSELSSSSFCCSSVLSVVLGVSWLNASVASG